MPVNFFTTLCKLLISTLHHHPANRCVAQSSTSLVICTTWATTTTTTQSTPAAWWTSSKDSGRIFTSPLRQSNISMTIVTVGRSVTMRSWLVRFLPPDRVYHRSSSTGEVHVAVSARDATATGMICSSPTLATTTLRPQFLQLFGLGCASVAFGTLPPTAVVVARGLWVVAALGTSPMAQLLIGRSAHDHHHPGAFAALALT